MVILSQPGVICMGFNEGKHSGGPCIMALLELEAADQLSCPAAFRCLQGFNEL